MTMLSLDTSTYEQMYHQMEGILTFVDTLNEIQLPDHVEPINNYRSLDREYVDHHIDLMQNVEHPIANNMIQIKFKR